MTDDRERASLPDDLEMYRRLVEDGPVSIYVHDGRTVLFANEQFAELLRAPSADAVVGRTLDSFVHPDDLAAVRKRVAQLPGSEGFNPSFIGRMVRFDGTDVHVNVRAIRSTFHGQPAVQVVVLDITDQHRAEQSLRERESVMRAIFEAIEGNLTLMAVEAPGRYRITEINPFAERESGFPRERIIGGIVEASYSPAIARLVLLLDRVVAEGRPIREEFESDLARSYRCAVATLCPIKDAEGIVRQVLFVAIPIDDRKKVEEALSSSRERYRALVDAHPDTILRVRRDGHLIDVHAPSRRDRLPPNSALALADFFPEHLWPQLRQLVDAVLAEGAEPTTASTELLDDARALELRVIRSGPDEATVIVRDTSDLRTMQRRLLAAERMASLGTLAAGVAHEINNPLAFVIGNHDVARHALDAAAAAMRAGEPERAMDRVQSAAAALRDAEEGARRVQHTVRDLKALSRVDDESRVPVDVARVVRRTLHLAANSIRHHVDLISDVQEVPTVMANEQRLGQVVLNLVLNASDAISDDSKSREVRVTLRAEGDDVVLLVSDTGAGIPADVLPRIFEPFFTTKSVGHGTGLGLSICHGIVSSLGGDIAVTSTSRAGTTFRVRLPSVSLAAPSSKPLTEPPPSAARLRILIVDDEPLLGRVLKRLLDPKHHIVIASSGIEALARLDDSGPFDLVLCDLMMPNMTGMELFEKLREERPDVATRMAFMTGGAVTQAAQQFLEHYAPTVLDKPFTSRDVERVLRQAMPR